MKLRLTNMVKICAYYFLFLFGTLAHGQTLSDNYELAKEEICKNDILCQLIERYNIKEDEKEGPTAIIFTKCEIDTIESYNDFSEHIYHEADLLGQSVLQVGSYLKDSKLFISIGEIFGNQLIDVECKNEVCNTKFTEWYKTDNWLKLNKHDTLVNKLIVPLEISKVELSSMKNHKVGEIIYGKIIIKTQPYYYKPRFGDFEKISRTYEGYFKSKIQTRKL